MKNDENRPGTMKNHENLPGTMKNQPGTMKNHEKPTWQEKTKTSQTDRQNLPIIYRLKLL